MSQGPPEALPFANPFLPFVSLHFGAVMYILVWATKSLSRLMKEGIPLAEVNDDSNIWSSFSLVDISKSLLDPEKHSWQTLF